MIHGYRPIEEFFLFLTAEDLEEGKKWSAHAVVPPLDWEVSWSVKNYHKNLKDYGTSVGKKALCEFCISLVLLQFFTRKRFSFQAS